jgi:hypothetical protein
MTEKEEMTWLCENVSIIITKKMRNEEKSQAIIQKVIWK